MSRIRKVGIVARPDREDALKLAEKIGSHLREKGFSVFFEHAVRAEGTLPLRELDVDLVITIGGDGTILRTLAEIPNPETPLLAVNMGTKGTLTEVSPEDVFPALSKLIGGDFMLDKRLKLKISLNGKRLPDALNEVLLTCYPHKLAYFDVTVDSIKVEYRSDGLIIATPTGSTAHSLSAGGSILHQGLNAFIITPICPLSSARPYVVPSSSKIQVSVKKPEKIYVVIDGFSHYEMERSKVVFLTESEHKAVFVRFKYSS